MNFYYSQEHNTKKEELNIINDFHGDMSIAKSALAKLPAWGAKQ